MLFKACVWNYYRDWELCLFQPYRRSRSTNRGVIVPQGFNQGLGQNGARPPIFHFSLADSIYQQCPDKNKICNLNPSRAKPPRWTGLPGG